MQPLLSICISSYNAAHLLRVTLEAILPQVRESEGMVEVLVVDDRSTDDTQESVLRMVDDGQLRYIRNDTNLGSSANLVNGPVNHAKGEFVWCWNQHCLIFPGALAKLLLTLTQHRHLDVFYCNFRCATYPQHWPVSAAGGYEGECDYVSRPDMNDRQVDRWQELLEAQNCVGTQSYAHIVRRTVWTSYWKGRTVGESYRSAISTYPHTCMLAETVFHKPSYYVGSPLLTIFNGAQSWSDLRSRAKVYFVGYPELICIYEKVGLEGPQLDAAEKWGAEMAASVAEGAWVQRREDVTRMIPRYLLTYGRKTGALAGIWRAFVRSRCCLLARLLAATVDCAVHWKQRISRCRSYLFHRCRPARWIRARAHPSR